MAAAADGTSSRLGTRGQRSELCPDLVGVRVLELLEDGQRLSPCLAGGAGSAGGVVGVAEVREDVGLLVAVDGLPDQLECPPVAGHGLVVLPEAVVGATDAVPGSRLTGAVKSSETLTRCRCCC